MPNGHEEYERVKRALANRGFGAGKKWNLASKPEIVAVILELAKELAGKDVKDGKPEAVRRETPSSPAGSG